MSAASIEKMKIQLKITNFRSKRSGLAPMSVFSFNIFHAQSHVKSWVPSRNAELSNNNIIDISGNDKYKLCLSNTGHVFVQGNISFMDPNNFNQMTLLPHMPETKAIQLSTSTEVFAILFSDGSVYACGANFGSTPKLINGTGVAKEIAVNRHHILVSSGDTLYDYSSTNEYNLINLSDRKVRCIASYQPGFLVLLDDGVLYSTFVVQNLGPYVESIYKGLHIVTVFLGAEIVYMETSLDEIICIYCDGSITYGWGDQDHSNSYPVIVTLPKFPFDGSYICHAHVSRDIIWFLTSFDEVFYISKLPWLDPDNGSVSRFKHVPSSFPKKIQHFKSTWNEIYFFSEGIDHKPMVSNLSRISLKKQESPFLVYSKSLGTISVDPFGASPYGFRAGDQIKTDTGKQIIVYGKYQQYLIYQESIGHPLEVILMPDLSTSLFKWKLCDRHGAELIEIEVKQNQFCQIDSSNDGVQRLCYFKPGDIIEHEKFGQGVILGERCDCLWIKYESGIKMCKNSSCQTIHKEHKFVSRPSSKILQYISVEGELVLIEPTRLGVFEPNCLVESEQYGIGTYIGMASAKHAVMFLIDSNFCRLIDCCHQLKIVRSISPHMVQSICIDSSIQNIDICSTSLKDMNLMPTDLVKVDNQIARCIGCIYIEKQKIALFETELMIKHGLGIGAFQPNVSIELLARIEEEGTRTMKKQDGSSIELSVNTKDFSAESILPQDVVSIEKQYYTVVGIANKIIYVHNHKKDYIEPLAHDYKLVYRRINVPTSIQITVSGKKMFGWIDIEHVRDKAIFPYDVVDKDGKEITIVGIIDSTHFIYTNQQKTKADVYVLPCGKTPNILYSVFEQE